MDEIRVLKYELKNQIELNLSYIPFIRDGGLFIPSVDQFTLEDKVNVELLLPGKTEPIHIEGKVVWIIPQNALHHVIPGIGIQFIGQNAQQVLNLIESELDKSIEVGGYTYGMTETTRDNL